MRPVTALLGSARGILDHGPEEVNENMRGASARSSAHHARHAILVWSCEGQNVRIPAIIASMTTPEPTIGDILAGA